MNLRPICAAAVLFAATLSLNAQAQDAHWVASWGTAPVQTTDTGRTVVLGQPAPAAPPPAVQPNAATPTPPSPATVPAHTATPASPRPSTIGSEDLTLRQTVHLSLGGSAIRVVLTNEYGTDPLTIGAAAVGKDKLTFGGKPSIVIPPGAIAVSDPINMQVSALSDLEIGLFIPAQKITNLTRHTGALQTNYIQPGNFAVLQDDYTATPAMAPVYSWTFLKSVDVLAPANTASVVAFGDSITDGAYATRDQNARWPDDLARRLQADPRTKNLAVLDEGIGGNRVLYDNTGPSALARFTRDALDQAGVKYIIVLEAINDIGNAFRSTNPKDPVTAETLIQGYQQLIARAHIHGIKVFLATLTPYGGAGYMSPAGDNVRQAVNQWIRTSHEADGMIDFDKATRDPANPDKFLPAYDHGDHLHPTDAGLKAMADAIDLSLFTK